MPITWTAEQEVEAIKQQLPTGDWKRGASLARCVEDLRMDRDALARLLHEGLAILTPINNGDSIIDDWERLSDWMKAARQAARGGTEQ